MKHIIIKIIKHIILFILILTFFGVIATTALTLQKPKIVIGMLEQLLPTPTAVPIQIKGIAVLGDSQSDEYRADDNRGSNYSSVTLNWVELLAEKRNLNFGEWGIWEEPRRTGYAYNWARSGATANSLLESGQHLGMKEQIESGKVNVVIVYIGANDFAPYITHDGYEVIYDGSLSDASLRRKTNRIIADIKTVVDTIKSNNDVRILLVKIPDWGNHIGVQIAFPFPDQRNRVTEAIQTANTELEQIAKDRGIPTVDPNEFFNALTRKGNRAQIMVGGVTLERLLLNNNPRNMFLEDGIHSGTVLNALFANCILQHFNTYFGTHIPLLTDKEILTAAGL